MRGKIDTVIACSFLLLAIAMVVPVHAQSISYPTLQDRITLATNWLLSYKAYNFTTVDDLGKTLVYLSDLRQVLPGQFPVEPTMARLTALMLAHVTSNMTFSYLDPTGRFISQDFGWWNAFAAEAIAISSVRMLLSPDLDPQSKTLYLNATEMVEKIITKWEPVSAQADGSWMFAYPYVGQDNSLDANAMMLTALTYLASFEQTRGDPLHQVSQFTTWSSQIAGWILARQETKLLWLRGGFYNDGANQTMYTDSNARAVFALITYANQIGTLSSNPSPTRLEVLTALQFWTNFIPYSTYTPSSSFGMRDQYDYGPYWYVTKCSSGPSSLEVGVNGTVYDQQEGLCFFRYPKETWRAAVVGRALLGLYNVTTNADLVLRAIYYYGWMTGNNELQTDLQQTAGQTQAMAVPFGMLIPPGRGGFWIGIKRSGWTPNATHTTPTLMPSHAPLESTAESADFLIHLLDKWTGLSWTIETTTLTPTNSQQMIFDNLTHKLESIAVTAYTDLFGN
ncbi:MAG TPA: hypothetical protein VJZ32_04170 [Candidatus Bathyarchaeia archaeon]|nr:hypothetical protein [Candidatus Bathyarchaeia archaeon]